MSDYYKKHGTHETDATDGTPGQCEGGSCPVPGASAPGAAPYADVEEFRVACAEWATKHQLNMTADWRGMTERIAALGYRCPCQVTAPACPCPAGVRQARLLGECACGLFHTRGAQ